MHRCERLSEVGSEYELYLGSLVARFFALFSPVAFSLILFCTQLKPLHTNDIVQDYSVMAGRLSVFPLHNHPQTYILMLLMLEINHSIFSSLINSLILFNLRNTLTNSLHKSLFRCMPGLLLARLPQVANDFENKL